MPEESIDVGINFELDSNEVQQLLQSQIQEISSSFSSVLSDIDAIARSIQDITGPMRDLADSAKAFEDSLEKVKRLSEDIRNNVASTRLQTGAGIGGPATGGGGIGGMLGAGGVMGGVMAGVTAAAPLAIGGGALLGGTVASAQAFGGGTIMGTIQQMLRGTPLGGLLTDERETRQRDIDTRRILSSGTYGGMLQAYQAGRTPAEIMQNMSASDRAFAMGGMQGLVRGAGQGPMGMFSQFVGGAVGGRGGAEAARQMELGEVGQQIGGAIGSSMFPGMFQNFIQQSMQSYPQYLQTMASQAAVGQYGGSIRDIRRLRPTQFGYAPGEIGGALSGLFQGFGGGELTLETQRTAMAYSRAYGVDMGQIGQSMGGLLNIGGGGQGFGAGTREAMMARVMTDAVAEGFGRRLPEYAQAVGAGIQTVMAGPALISQDAMPNLIQTMSSLTGRVATAQGLGLQGAQRMLDPLARAPQEMLQGLMSGSGDPFRMSMMWSTNRQRFGNDPMAMMRGLVSASQDPFSEEALEFQRGGIEQILGSSQNDYTAMMSLQRMMPNISAQGAMQVIERGREVMAETGSLAGVDMLELFTGVENTQESEGEQTRELMEQIQADGEEIMRDQLRAMQANAGFQAQQLSVAAAGAERARQFYDVQLGYSRLSAEMISASAAGTAISTLSDIFGPEFRQKLREMPEGERIPQLMRRMIGFATSMGMDPERQQARLTEAQIQEDILRATPVAPSIRNVNVQDLTNAVTSVAQTAVSRVIPGGD